MQKITLDINPKGEIPFLYFSQYDNGRLFQIELVDGEQAYNIPSGYSVQLNVRKTDSKLVTAAPTNVADNILTFSTTEQMTACAGENIASVTLKDADDIVITSLYFLIVVQRDVLAGGLDSQSEIHNLEQQIAAIVPEVIGDDYYNKTETDALLADKVNRSELSDLASKAELEYAIDEEDRALKDWAFTQFASPGYIAQRYYNKTQVDELIDNIFPTLSASGAIASFITALNKPLVSVTHEEGATSITRCGKNLINITEPIVINTGVTSDRLVTTFEVVAGVTYTLSCMQENAMTSNERNTLFVVINGVRTYENSTANYHLSSGIHSLTFTPSVSGECQIRIWGHTLSTQTTYDDFQLEVGSTASEYHAYNGQTVSVADALTLTTLSGVNNVFADVGDVTVQYKYMSI